MGSALIGTAIAAAAGVAAWTLISSYDDLVASPERYGATWDVLVGNVANAKATEPDRDGPVILASAGLGFWTATPE